jgi:hypothetical protein
MILLRGFLVGVYRALVGIFRGVSIGMLVHIGIGIDDVGVREVEVVTGWNVLDGLCSVRLADNFLTGLDLCGFQGWLF